MKKSISLFLAIIMLFSVVNVSVFAATIATPKTTSANAVGGIQVDWNEVSGAVKYNVYRRSAGEKNYTYIGTTTGNTYLDKTVKNGQYYCYTVRSFDADGGYSAYVYANTSTRKYVATPKLTKLVNATGGLTLSWNSVLSGASYRVYRRGAGQTTWTYLGTTTATTYTDSKATSGNYWRYTVRAVSSGYYSGFDTNGLYTMRLANPYSIKGTVKVGYVSVTWGKVNGATSYRVYKRSAGQTTWTYLGTSATTSFIDSNVVKGQYYRYTVKAMRGNISSGYYTNSPALKYTSHNPTKDPKVFPLLWENFKAFGYMCGTKVDNSKGQFDSYVPSKYRGKFDYFIMRVDCCKNYNDYLEHIGFYVDTKCVDVSEHLVSRDLTFVKNDQLYIICLSGFGWPAYELEKITNKADGTIFLEMEAFPPGEEAYLTLRYVNGTLKVTGVDDWENRH